MRFLSYPPHGAVACQNESGCNRIVFEFEREPKLEILFPVLDPFLVVVQVVVVWPTERNRPKVLIANPHAFNAAELMRDIEEVVCRRFGIAARHRASLLANIFEMLTAITGATFRGLMCALKSILEVDLINPRCLQ